MCFDMDRNQGSEVVVVSGLTETAEHFGVDIIHAVDEASTRQEMPRLGERTRLVATSALVQRTVANAELVRGTPEEADGRRPSVALER
tara:strand:- start:943 stop:1206 length:264 start_codon:yes stop_codon:yes gene_type:complete